MHVPVLPTEVLEGLRVLPEGTYFDVTAGLGGHSRAIAERLTSGRLYSCDRDSESLELAKANCAGFLERVEFVHAAFSELTEALKARGAGQADGLLADLGVSRMQLTTPERGFSLMADGPLDMRMNRNSDGPTAADIVNFTHENELADIIYKFGEERRSRRIARAIVKARQIRSTRQLAEVIESAVPRIGKIHQATQTFQALRIHVNGELDEIEALLNAIPELVAKGGRVAFISFHSLEDRILKRRFQQWAREGKVDILTKHVVKPSQEEIDTNKASRSAKLRLVEVK